MFFRHHAGDAAVGLDRKAGRAAGLTLDILAVGVAEKDGGTCLRVQMPIAPSSESAPSRSRSFSLWGMRYLFKGGLSPEGCRVRITGLEEHSLKGTLLNELHQDFGCHRGEGLFFFVQQNQDQQFFCCCVFPARRSQKRSEVVANRRSTTMREAQEFIQMHTDD